MSNTWHSSESFFSSVSGLWISESTELTIGVNEAVNGGKIEFSWLSNRSAAVGVRIDVKFVEEEEWQLKTRPWLFAWMAFAESYVFWIEEHCSNSFRFGWKKLSEVTEAEPLVLKVSAGYWFGVWPAKLSFCKCLFCNWLFCIWLFCTWLLSDWLFLLKNWLIFSSETELLG